MGRHPKASNRTPKARLDPHVGLGNALAAAKAELGIELTEKQRLIPLEMTFRAWCDKLAAEGLKIDGKPFRLDDRPAMAWVYDQVPSTAGEAFRRVLVMMKCAQVGFTVFEMLASLYWALKFSPATIGFFLPDQDTASRISTNRFMPIVRTVPDAYKLMRQEDPAGGGRMPGEGNVRTRGIADSLFIFGWTSGKVTTESMPMDILAFDEVQEMTLAQLEKTHERISASTIRYSLMGSTANWPDADIHHWFKRGTQHRFHTRCPTCGAAKPLDDYFPACLRWDETMIDSLTGAPGSWRYVCEAGHWIDDPQQGEWIADNPDAWIRSLHFTQMLSPTVTPSEIMEKYTASTDKKNFYNRVLGKPWLDPEQTPVSLEAMARCVAAGRAYVFPDGRVGVRWKPSARGCFMGIDQMKFNVVMIKERLPDGRQAVVHMEEIYTESPFERCSELMELYGVAVAVVEINPNYTEAKRFAGRHPGRVFLCNSFGSLPDDMVRWGDAPKLDVSERRTDEGERDRYTVRIDQYKTMQTAFSRFTAPTPLCLWPDPQELIQNVIEKDMPQRVAVAPRAFYHFTRTALVAEKDEETNQYKRVVKKIGIDPHWSYANQLCDVALARAHGTATFFIPEGKSSPTNPSAEPATPWYETSPMSPELAIVIEIDDRLALNEKCGSCEAYPVNGDRSLYGRGLCRVRSGPAFQYMVHARDQACPLYVGDDMTEGRDD